MIEPQKMFEWIEDELETTRKKRERLEANIFIQIFASDALKEIKRYEQSLKTLRHLITFNLL